MVGCSRRPDEAIKIVGFVRLFTIGGVALGAVCEL